MEVDVEEELEGGVWMWDVVGKCKERGGRYQSQG